LTNESQEFPNAKLKLSGQSKFCVWRIIAVTLTAAKKSQNWNSNATLTIYNSELQDAPLDSFDKVLQVSHVSNPKATQLDGLTLMQQSGKIKPPRCFFLNVLCISDPRKLHIKIIKLQITIDSNASRPNS
jgi:hypothetical protein